jgi:hypothetical protein
MRKCDICDKEVYTYAGPRWDQTGIELPLKEHKDITIILCWDCYEKYKEDAEKIV